MFIFAIFAFVIAFAALVWVILLVRKHWKEIRLLDPLSIKEERERQRREALLKRRFERLNADKIQPFRRLGEKMKRRVNHFYQKTYARLQAFESFYKNIKHPFSTVTPSTRERISTLLHEARALIRDLKWADAERRYLEVLSLDPRHAEAYKGLGFIYLKQKLFPQAKETFQFLIKMKEADDSTYAGLAEIAEAEEDKSEAESWHLKAVESSPRQAHRHAQLAQFYLDRHELAKAWPSAKRASDLEPLSAKYLELSLEIALQLGDRKEARHRYDRLRLLTEDRTKYQIWKEKVETLETTGESEKKKEVKS
ncbi:MAG TPA: hypothetical protein VFQ60_05480 [Patescibacteria group bacterium]|nr:hypothetical protein [Patescibacteria group bacterium]